MAHEQVHARIDKNTGKLYIEGDGFQGDDCDILKDVEMKLGNITHSEDKDERYNYVQPDLLPNQLSG